jgi:pimeloyl-ACP methyl ester carboxylesterase
MTRSGFFPRLARRIVKGVAALTVALILGVAVLVAGLWLEHRTPLTLPTPTGPFAVGRVSEAWTDETSVDALAPEPGAQREVLVWIWYPSTATAGAATDEYLSAPMRDAVVRSRGSIISGLLTRDLLKVRTNSLRDAPVSTEQPSYPVVIMRGGASAEVANYSTLAEDLASHGYVVVGVDAPYRTGLVAFPDGRVVARRPENNPELCAAANRESCIGRLLAAWTSDIGFALDRLAQLNRADPSDRFTGRLDLTRVGVFGHSFGGAQAAQFCHEDARCKAGIDVDGAPFGSVVQRGLDKPFMFLVSDRGELSNDDDRRIRGEIQSIYDRLPPDGRLLIGIRGAFHFTFSDDGALLKSSVLRGVLRAFGRLRIDGRRQLAVTAHCIHTFFDAFLKHAGAAPPVLLSASYPELFVPE